MNIVIVQISSPKGEKKTQQKTEHTQQTNKQTKTFLVIVNQKEPTLQNS